MCMYKTKPKSKENFIIKIFLLDKDALLSKKKKKKWYNN